MSVSVFIWGMFTWNFAQMFGSFTCLLQKKGSGSTVNKKTMTSFFITTFIDLRHIVLFCLNTWTITLHYLWFDCYLRCCVLHVLRCTSVWTQQHNYNVYCWDSSCQCINSPPPWIQTALVVKKSVYCDSIQCTVWGSSFLLSHPKHTANHLSSSTL